MVKITARIMVTIALGCILATIGFCFVGCDFGNKPDKFKLSYARGADDATGEFPAVAEYANGEKVSLAYANVFARNDYDFVCWNDGSINIQPGAIYTMPNKDVTITAVWRKKPIADPCAAGHDYVDGVCARCGNSDPDYVPPVTEYSVTYLSGGTDVTGTPPPSAQYAAGVSVVIAANTFTYANHNFSGWKYDNTVYQPKGNFVMPAHSVTFTATWQAVNPCIAGHNYISGVCTRCGGIDDSYKPPVDTLSMLRASGDKVVDSAGREVLLRGTNVGGLLITENWMNSFDDAGGKDYYTIKKKLISRFGKSKADELWSVYRENWWTDIDFELCVEMGINVLRLPFTYMDIDPYALDDLTLGGKNYDFSALDKFVAGAEKYGLYVILDMHGAYGSQNGQDHSGQILEREQVDFYSNETKIKLTIDLWKAVAAHFKDNPTVAAYDILNEPGVKGDWINDNQTTQKPHWDVFNRIYQAIRQVDGKHMVIFESCWGEYNLPMPSRYGWTNCMYSFHHYNTIEDNPTAFEADITEKVKKLVDRKFGVPLQMGEFTAYKNINQWRTVLRTLNNNNMSWCTWSYKANSKGASSWGILNKNYVAKVNANVDSYETIKQRFIAQKTTGKAEYYKFSNGVALATVIKENTDMRVTAVTVVSRSGKPYLQITGTYKSVFSDSAALGVLKSSFYADWLNNGDANGAGGSDWGNPYVYDLNSNASISTSGGIYIVLLDISSVPKGYIVFFHFGGASANLVCKNTSGKVTMSDKSYELGIFDGWNSDLVSLKVV